MLKKDLFPTITTSDESRFNNRRHFAQFDNFLYRDSFLKISATPNSTRMHSGVNKTQNMPPPQKKQNPKTATTVNRT